MLVHTQPLLHRVRRELERANRTGTSPRMMHWMATKPYQCVLLKSFSYLLTDVPYWTFKLARYWSSIHRYSVEYRPRLDRQSTDIKPIVDRYTTDSIAVDMSTDTMSIIEWTIGRYIGRHSTDIATYTRSSIDRYSVEYRPMHRPIYRPIHRSIYRSRPPIRYMIQHVNLHCTLELLFWIDLSLLMSRNAGWRDSCSLWISITK